MQRIIKTTDFPELIYLLEGYLYEQVDDIETLLHGYIVANGKQRASLVMSEITELLNKGYSEEEITRFVTNHSLYLVDDSGSATLRLIYNILRATISITSINRFVT